MRRQSVPRSKRAVRPVGKGTRDDFHFRALLGIFLFSVLVIVVSMLILPYDELPAGKKQSEFYEGSIRKGRKLPPKTTKSEDDDYHIVFSTACSPFQDWQAYVFFYFAWKVKQPGHITRIASGCEFEKQEALKKFHEEYVAPFSDRFHLHFTPDYSMISGRPPFKYYNKPFGVRHWMENAMGYPENRKNDDAIFMILDPDMYPFRAIRNNFTGVEMLNDDTRGPMKVEHGRPFAQKYGFGDAWAKHNISYVAGADSPALAVKGTKSANDNYSIGPPYMATGKDMYDIVVKWTEFVPRVHEVHDSFLGEMYAFCQAAAHLELPHKTATGFMISDVVDINTEGWGFLKDVAREDVCQPVDIERLPLVFHYCQRYALGRWFVGKYKLPENFFWSCSSPLLRVPPRDIAAQHDGYLMPNLQERHVYKPSHEHHIKQSGFMLCTLIDAFNEVATYFKTRHCKEPNLNKTLIFHKSIEEPW